MQNKEAFPSGENPLKELAGELAEYQHGFRPPKDLVELETFRWVRVNGGLCMVVDERSRPKIPSLIEKGVVAEDLVAGWATFRQRFGDDFFPQYRDLFEAAEKTLGIEFNPKLLERKPLASRLSWTIQNPEDRDEEATRRRIKSTDLIRTKLIPRYHERGLDILTQIRLIHRAHMRGNEHVLLEPSQAKRILETKIESVDRLAGVIRSSDRLAVNVSLGSLNTLCAAYDVTPDLMRQFADTAEELFPLNGINPTVNESNIRYIASAFQYIFALIHPFYEANGRTSEDLMYILWQRRPDLAHTVRYPSFDGTREGEIVEERDEIINKGATGILRVIASNCYKLDPATVRSLNRYEDLEKVMLGLPEKDRKSDSFYANRFMTAMEIFIEDIGKPRMWLSEVIIKLADNLRRSSTTYYPQI